jgi:hypothetical protein
MNENDDPRGSMTIAACAFILFCLVIGSFIGFGIMTMIGSC